MSAPFERLARFAVVPAAVLGAFLISHIGNLFLGEHGLAVWWPLNGVIVATLLLTAPKRRLGLLAAATAGNMAAYAYSDFGILSVWYGLGDAAEVWLATWALGRFAGRRLDLSDTRHVLALVLTAALAAILPGLMCAIPAASVGHHGFFAFFGTWWLADALGMILAVPGVLAFADLVRERRPVTLRACVEPAAVTLLTCGVAATATTLTLHAPGVLAGLRYLVFPLLIWSALRQSPQVTAIAVMTSAVSAICMAAPLVQPLTAADAAQMLEIQIFLGVVGITALLLAAAAQGLRDAIVRAVSSEDALRRLSVDLDRAREDERARISAEIHDELGQELTALKIEVARGSHDAPRWRLAVLPQIDRAIASVRRLATELRPPTLDHLGLPEAIESHVQQFGRRTGVRVRASIGQAGRSLSGEPALAVYRVAQEALTNVVRHAGAGSVSVDMTEDDGALVMEIADDGRGFDGRTTGPGLGILGMRERLTRVGGSFLIEGRRQGGTIVRCRVPLSTHGTRGAAA